MSSPLFSGVYASAYDSLYEVKDYPAECDLLEEAFRRHGDSGVHSVVDLGCGTGSHAILLAERGYRVVGVDQSPEMLRIADSKSRSRGFEIEWVTGDLKTVNLGEVFDAAILMFAVLGYFTSDDKAAAAFANVARHVRPGGMLCFDVWHGPAVQAQGVHVRSRTVTGADGPLTRTTSARLLAKENVCEVHFDVTSEASNSLASRETHRVRYFFRDEIERLLAGAGFEMVSFSAFPELDRQPQPSDWYAFCVGQRMA